MKDLKDDEKERLRSALQRLIDEERYVEVAKIHGAPYNETCQQTREHRKGMCCRHGGVTGTWSLLPWHRLFMAQMEEELGEALPYWDWTDPETKD